MERKRDWWETPTVSQGIAGRGVSDPKGELWTEPPPPVIKKRVPYSENTDYTPVIRE